MTNVKKVVDADTHISESESMWELFDREMYKRRPVLVSVPDNTLYGDRNAFWLIDGNIFPKPAGKGGFNLITPSVAKTPAGENRYQPRLPRSNRFRSAAKRYGPDGLRRPGNLPDIVSDLSHR